MTASNRAQSAASVEDEATLRAALYSWSQVRPENSPATLRPVSNTEMACRRDRGQLPKVLPLHPARAHSLLRPPRGDAGRFNLRIPSRTNTPAPITHRRAPREV